MLRRWREYRLEVKKLAWRQMSEDNLDLAERAVARCRTLEAERDAHRIEAKHAHLRVDSDETPDTLFSLPTPSRHDQYIQEGWAA